MTVRTRFAPSPTGDLHIGSVRTALYAWLYARKHQGQFILRIEDTDRERSTEASIQAILEGMTWLNLDYDEGPFYQMDRLERYREVATQWLNTGKAYRCSCSKERLEAMRNAQMARKEKPRYDGHCRDKLIAASEPHVIRFRHPDVGEVSFHDEVHGLLSFANSELDDLVLVRTDGVPTYNFAVVIDDADMNITHVIRGDDHINNTPRQIHLLQALGAPIPQYAHLPMILGADGKRLSKRHGAVSVMQYCEEGFLPQALLNYLLRLGWSHGDQEIFSRAEMIDLFDLGHISLSPASFNPEKLLWVNQHYIKHSTQEDLLPHVQRQFTKQHITIKDEPPITAMIDLQRDRAKTLLEMVEKSRWFYEPITAYDTKAASQFLHKDTLPILQYCVAQLMALQTWDIAILHDLIPEIVKALGLKMPNVAQPLRVALTGNTHSPSIDATLFWLGKNTVIHRLNNAMDYITQLQEV